MMSDDYHTEPPVFTALERIDRAHAAAATVIDELEAIDSDEPATLAFALELVREVKRSLGDQERALVQAVADCSDERQFEVPDLGVVQIRFGMKRTGWQKDDVAREFVRAFGARYDLTDDVLTLVTKALEDFRDVVSVSGAKKPFVAYTGRELDEFCEEEPQGVSVQITTPGPPARIED